MKHQTWAIGGTSHSSIFINQISEQPKQPERHYLAFTILEGSYLEFDSEFSVRWSKDKKTWIENNHIDVVPGETWYCTGDIVTTSFNGPIGTFKGDIRCNLSEHIDGLLHPLYYTGTTSREDVVNSFYNFLVGFGIAPENPNISYSEKEQLIIEFNTQDGISIFEDTMNILQNSGINQHTLKDVITLDAYPDEAGFFFNSISYEKLFNSSINPISIEDASDLIFRPSVTTAYVKSFGSVNKVTLTEGMFCIDNSMFYRCSLQEITISSTIKIIDIYAFEDNNQLSSITFKPKVCPNIKVGAFRGVPYEGTLYLPKDCDLESYANNLPGELSHWNYEFI